MLGYVLEPNNYSDDPDDAARMNVRAVGGAGPFEGRGHLGVSGGCYLREHFWASWRLGWENFARGLRRGLLMSAELSTFKHQGSCAH